MVWVVGIGVLVGLLMVASGVGTLRTGWVVPSARRHVARPKLYGLGALLIGVSILLQGLMYFRVLPSVPPEARYVGGNALLLGGLLLVALSQPRQRGGSVRADPSGS
ncbi:hypothetical protein [Streptomyces pilosus]|uniref:Uncharacterized protein n=1 Tax=Streptomyces pilosus TaxID=28893 RepID=A0A918ESP2_9ACTN|nr:hypothetical protein [Streptomyces pilosus]GGQ65769.1 hypothetical protein GCM10010280_10420 [Streptomyces pilosus]GGV33348.1 hypothetical protein GCM10010261_01280 [Streptomyces pilosus]